MASRGKLAGLAIGVGSWLAACPCGTAAEAERRAVVHPVQVAGPDSSLGTDALWSDIFGARGPTGSIGSYDLSRVTSAVIYNGDLVVAGTFSFMDGVPVPGVARWDGTRWHPVGSEPLPFHEGAVQCFIVYDGQLIAAGLITPEQGDSASCIVRLEGDVWRPLGGPIRSRAAASGVNTMCVVTGELVVGGFFDTANDLPAQSIARWNGHEWTPMGSDTLWGDAPVVFDLESYRGSLYAAGHFFLAPTDSGGHLAEWSGDHWRLVGEGADADVLALAVFDSLLVAGGRFNQIGSTTARRIAAFDGATWSALADGVGRYDYESVQRLLCFENRLVVAGDFNAAGAIAARGIAAWDGDSWRPLGEDALRDGNLVQALCLVEHEGRLVVGGVLYLSEMTGPHLLAAWNGTRWTTIAPERIALANQPHQFLASAGGLLVAGEFRIDGNLTPTPGVARWDGNQWLLLGPGMNDEVIALTEYRGRIIAGGRFENAGGTAASYIAQWDGASWSPLATGVDHVVFALTMHEDRLVAGGAFKHAGGLYVGEVAQWDGSKWSPMGLGIGGGNTWVDDLETYDGELIACGPFPYTGHGPGAAIARWDGNAWHRVGDGLESLGDVGRVTRLAVWDGRLVGRALFRGPGCSSWDALVLWNGSEWCELASPVDWGLFDEIGSYEGRLVVGGEVCCDSLQPQHIVQWDGEHWLRMGSGVWSGTEGHTVTPTVTALAAWNGSLYVGGSFQVAGDRASPFIARWDGAVFALPPPSVSLQLARNPVREMALFQWHLDDPGHVWLRVFDVSGRMVATLVDGRQPGGSGAHSWDLRDNGGRGLSSGVYFVYLQTSAGASSRKLAVLR